MTALRQVVDPSIIEGFREDWMLRANCKGCSEAAFELSVFVQRRFVIARCDDCPVQRKCLAYAIDNRIRHGVWGGKTENERRAMMGISRGHR